MRISGSVQHVFLRPSDRNADTGTATVVAPAGTIFRSSSSPSETRRLIQGRLLAIPVGVASRATDHISEEWSSDTRSPKDGPPRVPYYRLQQRRDHRAVRACSCDRYQFWRGGLSANSELVQVRCGHVDLSAEKSRAAGTGGVLWGISVDDLAGDHCDH